MKKSLLKKSLLIRFIFILTFSLSTLYWVGCESPSGPEDLQEQVLDQTHPQLRATFAVQERYADLIMSNPEVVGVGTSLTEEGTPSIVVFAKSEKLKIDASIKIETMAKGARLEAIPATVDDVPIVVEVTGEIKALHKKKCGPKDRLPRPVPIGVSTGHPDITVGTIGCRVTKDGKFYALSNNHIYADENEASIGDKVMQPGKLDGGSLQNDFMGELSDFQTIDFSISADNVIDAAIALSSTDLLGRATLSNGYGTPKADPIEANLKMKVKKYGRTTGQTKAKIYALNVTIYVSYDSGIARFVDQIAIRSNGFSAGGDSGSLIVVNGGKNDCRPVALLFAGGSGYTFANPISNVLSRFGVTIDGN